MNTPDYTNLALLQVDMDQLIFFEAELAERHGGLVKTIRRNGEPSERKVCHVGTGGVGVWCFLVSTLESNLKVLNTARTITTLVVCRIYRYVMVCLR